MYVFLIGSAVIINNLTTGKILAFRPARTRCPDCSKTYIYRQCRRRQLVRPKGEFLGGKGAEPVYALYGLNGIGCEEMPPVDTPYMNGSIAYHNRKGPHAILPYDWEQFLRFADKYFKNK